MKNRLYNRIIVSGLLSSSLVLFGSQQPTLSISSSDLTASSTTTSTTTPPHHQGLLHKFEDAAQNLFSHSGEKSPRGTASDGSLTPTPAPKVKRLKSPSHSDKSSLSTPVPFVSPDPTHPLAATHHHHFKKDVETIVHNVETGVIKLEHLVLKYGNVVLQDIINNPAIITDILTAVGVNQAEAQSITKMVEAGSARAQTVVSALDNWILQAQAQKLAAEQAAPKPLSEMQKVEGVVLAPIIAILNLANNHPTIFSFVLNEILTPTNATTAMTELQAYGPGLTTYIQDLQPVASNAQPANTTSTTSTSQPPTPPTVAAGSGFGSYKLISGAAMTFIAFLVMLHKTNYLPANISTLLNNIISSALNQNLVQTVTQAL